MSLKNSQTSYSIIAINMVYSKIMRTYNLTILVSLLVIFPLSVLAQTPKSHLYYEKDYQNMWCNAQSGITEYVLPDRARVDCVTQIYAIEFDFAKKWSESIGQSLYYAAILQKDPGIVLIVEDEIKDQKYINRLQTVATKQGIKVWLMHPEDMNQ